MKNRSFHPIIFFVVVFAALQGCTEVTNETDTRKTHIQSSGSTLLPNLSASQFILGSTDPNGFRNKSDGMYVQWDSIERLLQQAQVQTSQELVAIFSVRDSSGNGYQYYLQPLRFSPQAMREANGETQPFIYEPTSDDKGTVPRIAIAVIPDGQIAYEEIESWILPSSNLDE